MVLTRFERFISCVLHHHLKLVSHISGCELHLPGCIRDKWRFRLIDPPLKMWSSSCPLLIGRGKPLDMQKTLVNPTSSKSSKIRFRFSQNVFSPHWYCHKPTTTYNPSNLKRIPPFRQGDRSDSFHPCNCSAQCRLLGNRWCRAPADFSCQKGSSGFSWNFKATPPEIRPYQTIMVLHNSLIRRLTVFFWGSRVTFFRVRLRLKRQETYGLNREDDFHAAAP